MDHKYMIVAFLYDKPVGLKLEPPKHPHITVKKKFKLKGINEKELGELLLSDKGLHGSKPLQTGESQEYGSDENMIITIENETVWRQLHQHLLELLDPISESRDPHFEGEHYLPHITWKLKGEVNFDPVQLENHRFTVNYLYLIKRIHPTKSIAQVVAKIPLAT